MPPLPSSFVPASAIHLFGWSCGRDSRTAVVLAQALGATRFIRLNTLRKSQRFSVTITEASTSSKKY